MLATKLKTKPLCARSYALAENDEIFITGWPLHGYYKKGYLHDYIKLSPGSIKVNIWPYPALIPAVSGNGEKYVRSRPDATRRDNLLNLPRE